MAASDKTAPGLAGSASSIDAADTLESGGAPAGTIQMRGGQPLDAPGMAAPVMATITGSIVPGVLPPAMPSARYELGDEIARGGMGRVVEATDTLLGRVVALKEALSLDAEALRRFQRETKITARLEHPSIVPVHDAGTMAGGAPYYVMRKVEGRPLERLVATAETLEQRLALIPHIVAASHAVAHAHSRGIVHRDIKPSNILAGDLGETIVIDWGLAKVIGEADELTSRAPSHADLDDDQIRTRAGIVFGTPGFMAPEQLRGLAVTERCDVYALGATLYHMLSRRPPHHAKTADEMMKAAAHAPPTPIGELVFGVPAELSTIVDKALAHDAKDRYQDARALAEDLQRFLTGQLVASHRYTAREKIVRFVRKNRTPVIVVTAAVLALVIGGTVAVTRVIGERDRADHEAHKAKAEQLLAEEQRVRAEDRADKLTLQQARSYVTSNPTQAIAMIKPLAAKQWREVRSIATAARAAGVAWSLPAPQRVSTVELSRDGVRALVAGDDGSVRIYDLAHRTSHVVLERGPRVSARFGDAETRVVVWTGTQLDVLDPVTGKRTAGITAPTPIRDLEIVGVTAYWIDEARALWQLDLSLGLSNATPLEIALDERIEQIAPSPDGRWIALHGETHLLLYDRSAPATPPLEVYFGQTKDLDWADDGSHLAALVDTSIIDVAMAPAPQIVHKAAVGNRQFVTYSTGRMYTIGPTGVGVASRQETGPRRMLVGDPVGLREAYDGAVVAGSQGGIAVLTDDGDHTLFIPAGRLDIVEASARSPYVVGVVEGYLLVWNLSEVLPRRLANQVPTLERFVGNDRVLASYIDNTAEWIDLASGKSTPLGSWSSALLDIAGAPDGRAACAIDLGHHARLVVEGPDAEELDGTVDIAGFASPTQLLLGTRAGTLQLHDLTTRRRTTLVSRHSQLVHMAWGNASPWIAAAFADGTLWRKNLATGVEATTSLPVVAGELLVDVDGTVVFGDTRTLRSWRTSGSIEPLATLPKPIVALGAAGPGLAVAFTRDTTSYVVELGTPDRFTESGMLDTAKAVMARDTGVMVLSQRGTIEVFDPIAKHRWTLASSPGLTLNTPLISNDGRHVIAHRLIADREKRDVEARTPTTLLYWNLDSPDSAASTVKWLEAMTNAVIDPRGPNGLGWQAPGRK